jgi:drug/metabolite transporter (DMT)-like permease
MQASAHGQHRWAGLAHLFVVYLVWGSTYLAIRVAVREGSGFPPFVMAGTRVLGASVLLFAWARWRGNRLATSARDMWVLAISGVLLWVGGNGLVVWAEQHAHSGYAALLIGTVPLWAAVLNAVTARRAPSWALVAAVLVGFGGLAVLTTPVLHGGSRSEIASVVALLGAALSWSTGSILQRNRGVDLRPTSSSAWQHLFAGIVFLILSFAFGEPRPEPTREAWGAWAYLVLFGSVFAFTSYVTALRLLPVNVVMTYAYVNPVVAVLLGWIVLQEPLTWWTAVGAVLVLTGVAGVFRTRDH